MTRRREALKALVTEEGITFAAPPVLVSPASYFDLAGEEFGARMLITQGADGTEFCLRPDFTLPIAIEHIAAGTRTPVVYGYLGPVFRQRAGGPAEFLQAGLEFLSVADADAALSRIVTFARACMDLYAVAGAQLRVGDVDLFEALLAACDMPDVWRPRLRARFGQPEALTALLERLGQKRGPDPVPEGVPPDAIADFIGELMLTHGISPHASRSPSEIAARYSEKRAREAARVPAATLELLRDYLAIKGAPDIAFAAVADLAHAHGLDLGDALARAAHRTAMLATGLGIAATFDAGFSPRLDYYTGVIFEVGAATGVLVSGGQYDRMLRRLGAQEDVPAVGCAVWVDRLEQEAAGL